MGRDCNVLVLLGGRGGWGVLERWLPNIVTILDSLHCTGNGMVCIYLHCEYTGMRDNGI